jgi:hypothetical protein
MTRWRPSLNRLQQEYWPRIPHHFKVIFRHPSRDSRSDGTRHNAQSFLPRILVDPSIKGRQSGGLFKQANFGYGSSGVSDFASIQLFKLNVG